MKKQLTGVELIAKERQRQIQDEKFDYEHDEDYCAFQLSAAAGCYIANAQNRYFEDHTHFDDMGDSVRFQLRKLETKKWGDAWPWDKEWDKRSKHDVMRSLVIAGALIAAEIDRLNDNTNEK